MFLQLSPSICDDVEAALRVSTSQLQLLLRSRLYWTEYKSDASFQAKSAAAAGEAARLVFISRLTGFPTGNGSSVAGGGRKRALNQDGCCALLLYSVV